MKRDDPKRGTGRTTALMLLALAKAVNNPGKEIEFVDHWRNSPMLADGIGGMAGALRLSGIVVTYHITDNRITVVSSPEMRAWEETCNGNANAVTRRFDSKKKTK